MMSRRRSISAASARRSEDAGSPRAGAAASRMPRTSAISKSLPCAAGVGECRFELRAGLGVGADLQEGDTAQPEQRGPEVVGRTHRLGARHVGERRVTVAAVEVQLRERQLGRRHVELGADAIQRRRGTASSRFVPHLRTAPHAPAMIPWARWRDPDPPRIIGRGPGRGRARDERVGFGEAALVGEDLGDVGVDERHVHRVAVLGPCDPGGAYQSSASAQRPS